MDYDIKKRLAFSYYMNPYSPTFMNALRSLIRAGYSYNYAKSYGSKVFFMDRFVNAPFMDRFVEAFLGLGKRKEGK